MSIMKSIKEKIPGSHKRRLRRILERWEANLSRGNLTQMAKIYKTDKYGFHFYTEHYQKHFLPYKNKRINLLEIGVGGYENPDSGGNSLRMWKSYFKNANIFSIDIFDKSKLEESRIRIFQGSQVDFDFLDSVLLETGEISIIIDDGSHQNEHVIKTFNYLFPKLCNNGIYVIEDVQTSYWPDYGGTSKNFYSEETIMGYFKKFLDGLNYSEFLIPDYKPSYFDLNIVSIHYYHNLIFIYKGSNTEKSNYLVGNQKPIKI